MDRVRDFSRAVAMVSNAAWWSSYCERNSVVLGLGEVHIIVALVRNWVAVEVGDGVVGDYASLRGNGSAQCADGLGMGHLLYRYVMIKVGEVGNSITSVGR